MTGFSSLYDHSGSLTPVSENHSEGGDKMNKKNLKATILLAHGSSDPHWLKPFDELLSQIRSSLQADGNRVDLAYMELAEPSLENQVALLAEAGYTHIDVLPLFFAAGRHLRIDVPLQIEELQKEHLIQLTLLAPVGLEPEVARAIAEVVIRQVI
ncbi:sirohydrochlorin chelatase [Parathalassolituus penaei]|mgnify:CR=1 FL=1|uniref:CbiX/SirB N-terminal domain-containing protein n=1 Tax=Parathalassolituus penaei TaxID=2997323 RepID=A0A9X3EBG0_9GAMM|nr:CbiX/SirB N-terminal domain-containing protein [Parathalassolituus penaei]MCY0964484.1 CbiX/SirB N-terminal domain-containing protein [Parathalassolituus penaei]